MRRHLWSLGSAGALALAVALGPVSGSRAGAQPAPPPPPVPNATLTPLGVQTPAASPLPSDVPVPTAAPSAVPPTVAPSETPAPRGRRRRRGGSPAASPSAAAATTAPAPTATPTSPAFATLDGTWELQLQYIDRTEYSYLTLAQTTGGALTGTWRMSGRNAPHYPLTGTYDGRLIRLTAVEPGGPVNFSGYVEGASDMIGLATFPSASPSPGASPVASPTPSLAPGALSPVAPTTANDGVAFTAEHRGSASHNVLKR